MMENQRAANERPLLVSPLQFRRNMTHRMTFAKDYYECSLNSARPRDARGPETRNFANCSEAVMLVVHLVSNPYPHSANADGKISSISPRCDLIIGCSTWEAELERMEAVHVCPAVGATALKSKTA
jgi:hypothetical protein